MIISYQIIGHNIKTARKNVHLTQEQVAERIGISALHYGRLERAERRPSIDQLARISDALNTSIEALLRGSILDKENHPALFESPDRQTRESGEYALLLLDAYREQIKAYYEALNHSARTFR